VNEGATPLLDRGLIDEIRKIEQATGQTQLFAGFVRKLEGFLAGFSADFTSLVARGDAAGAVRSAHTLKGTCRQLGAVALGDLFADIERSAKAGDFAQAMRTFEAAASLISASLQALKQA
jgi:HPt (histidine-containing phosphotransfer) domain-containing protein